MPKVSCLEVGFEGEERNNIAFMLVKAVPGIRGSQRERAQSLNRTGGLCIVQGKGCEVQKVMGREIRTMDDLERQGKEFVLDTGAYWGWRYMKRLVRCGPSSERGLGFEQESSK